MKGNMRGSELLKKELFKFWNRSNEYYQFARSLNIELSEERKQMLSYISDGDVVLDVASGSCENGLYIPKFAKYIGAEISIVALKMAKDFENDNFFLVRTDVETLPFADNSFDAVISTHSLEHFTNPKKVIDEMYRVCKHNGKIIMLSAAFDYPFGIPVSASKEFEGSIKRIKYYLNQIIKIFKIYLNIESFSPYIIHSPSVLYEDYSQDNDTVYIVNTLEVKKYFESLGCRIVYLQKGQYWFNKLLFCKYWFTSLFMVIEK